jgi:hypothetical protein
VLGSAPRSRKGLGVLSDLIVPPDFYPERQVDNQTWAESIFEPIALIGATICFLVGVVDLGLALDPGWPTRFLVPLAIVVGIEAFFYSRRLSRGTVQLKEWLVLLAPIVVLARLLPYLDDPTSSLGRDALGWISQPFSLFTLAFVVDLVLLLIEWTVVFGCTQLLNQLRVQPGEIVDATDRGSRFLQEDNVRAIDHGAPLRRLGEVFVWGGVILVTIAALAAIGTSQFLSIEAIGQLVGFQRPSLHVVQLNVVLYFFLGLLLLGEAHFVRQRTLWRIDRLAIAPEIPTRWVTGVIGLVVVAIVFAFVLPTSYAMTLGQLVGLVAYAIVYAVGVVGALLFYLAYLVMSLFRGPTSDASSPPHSLQPALPHPPVAPSGPSALDTIQSIVFWIVAAGVVAYSLGVIWRRRPAWLSQIRLGPILLLPWSLLRGLLRLGRRVSQDVARAVAAALPRLLRQTPPAAPRRFSFISLSRLAPGQLVEYFYLSVCERAAKLGYPRPDGVTPSEYEQQLQSALPLVDPEIAAVTAAFLEARYGPRPTTADQVKQVRSGWEALKKKLRGARVSKGRLGAR